MQHELTFFETGMFSWYHTLLVSSLHSYTWVSFKSLGQKDLTNNATDKSKLMLCTNGRQ